MKHYLIAERYARGLSASLPDDTSLDEVARALKTLSKLIDRNSELNHALLNPAIRLELRAEILRTIIARLELPAILNRFCVMLLERDRLVLLPELTRVYSALADERLNRIGVDVTTTQELDEAQIDRLRAQLEAYSGKTVRMDTAIDPEILGGVVARIGGTVIDGSIRTRLKRLRGMLLPEENVSG